MDLSKIKLVVIIQCEIAKRHCSGYHCSQSFYERSGGFSKYPMEQDMRVLMFQCGGCNGKGVNSLLSNVNKCLKKEASQIRKLYPEDVFQEDWDKSRRHKGQSFIRKSVMLRSGSSV